MRLVDAGVIVNEVEAAGNTPLHSAAYEGWLEGAELLLQLGAKVNASNNAGDTPWVSCWWVHCPHRARLGQTGVKMRSHVKMLQADLMRNCSARRAFTDIPGSI